MLYVSDGERMLPAAASNHLHADSKISVSTPINNEREAAYKSKQLKAAASHGGGGGGKTPLNGGISNMKIKKKYGDVSRRGGNLIA